MDRNKDAKLTYEEFKEGSKQDPTIVQVSSSVLVVVRGRHCATGSTCNAINERVLMSLGVVVIRRSRLGASPVERLVKRRVDAG